MPRNDQAVAEDVVDAPAATRVAEARSSALYVSESAARFASVVVTIVCSAFGLLALVGVMQSLGPGEAVLCALYTVLMLAVQLGYFSRSRAVLTPARTAAALAAQAALVYLPVVHFGTYWLGFPGFLAGSVLLGLPLVWGAPAFVVIIASTAVLEFVVGAGLTSITYAVTYTVVSTTITGLVIYGLSTLARLEA